MKRKLKIAVILIRQNTLTKYCFSPGILYNGLHQTKLGGTPYLENVHLRDRFKGTQASAAGVQTPEKGGSGMTFLEVLSRVVSILLGIVSSLTGIVTLIEKCKPYIDRRKAETEKDPSASLAATDGSRDDCESNR